MKLKIEVKLMLLLSIFYMVGLLGILIPEYRFYFLGLSPFNLLLTLALFSLANREFDRMFVLLFSIICIVGFFVEVLGVATGAIFGVYHYGEALGMQGLNVPFIIGVNWYLLAMATYEAFHYKRIHKLMRALLSAALMTFIDVLIEPLSAKLDFWYWSENIAPLQNYIAWFVVAFLFQLIIQQFRPQVNKTAAIFVIALQIIFFTSLHLFLK
jgi:putative membrane protein